MVVCICRRVSDKTIRATIKEGASTVDEVALACRAGTGCGACRPQIADMIHESSCSGSCADCPGKRVAVTSPYLALAGESAA